jgi:hypothetical protein
VIRNFVCALLLSALSLVGVGYVSAQTGPSTPPTSTPTVSTTALSEADLASYLRSLDSNLKVEQKDTATIYRLSITHDGWKYDVQVESSKGNVWVVVNLGKTPEQIKPEVLAGLLQANFKYGPTHFALLKLQSGYYLSAARSVDRTASLDLFKSHLAVVLKQIRESYPIWSQALEAK